MAGARRVAQFTNFHLFIIQISLKQYSSVWLLATIIVWYERVWLGMTHDA